MRANPDANVTEIIRMNFSAKFDCAVARAARKTAVEHADGANGPLSIRC